MMKFIASINEVNILRFYKHGFFTIFNEIIKFYKHDLSETKCLKLEGKSSSSTYTIENILFVEFFSPLNGFEDTYLTSLENLEKKIFQQFNGYLIRSNCNYNAIALKYDENFNETTSLLNLESGEFIWQKKLNYLPHFINQNLLLSAIKNNVIRFNLSGEELWTFDTNTLGTWIDYDKLEKQTEIRRVLGELDDKLYIYLNSGKILIINLNSGSILKILENHTYITNNSWSGNFDNNIEIDYSNKKLIQLFRTDYTEVDLSTLEIKKFGIESLKNQNLENINRIAFDDDYIFFSDRDECKVASFNRKTMQVDWVYAFSDNVSCEIGGNRYGKDLKLYGNRLYALDNKHTLHIFEKENA